MIKKICNLEIIVIIILVFSLIILFLKNKSFLKLNNEYKEKLINVNKIEFEYKSIKYFSKYIGKRFPIFKIKNLYNDKIYNTKFKNYTIIIIISNQGCSPCIRSELTLLGQIKNLNNNHINFDIIGISFDEIKDNLLKLKKISNFKYKLFIDEEGLLSAWCDCQNFPIIFLVDKFQKIQYCYYPLPNNIEFSKYNLSIIEQILFL